MERRRRAAVVHPDAGVVGREGVGEGRAGLDLDHLVVHRGLAGVEVDRVAHRALVGQVDVDRVAEVDPDRRPGHRAAERPGVDDEALGDRDVLLDDRQVDVVDRARAGARAPSGSNSVYLGAFGSATGATRPPAPRQARRWRRPAPPRATMTCALHPASAWPGIEHMNARPAAGTVTLPVAVCAGLGGELRAVREGDVVEGRAGVVERRPVRARGRDRARRGVNPRSNASMLMASCVASSGAAAAALAAGCAEPVSAAANFQLGAAGLLQAPTASARRPAAAMMRRVRSMSSSLRGSGTPRPGHRPRAWRSICRRRSW